MEEKIRVGISSCLLGNRVRYDGDHRQDCYLTETLGRFMEFVPVCPETECGLGVPRETMQLVGAPQHPRLMTTATGIDHTGRLLSWAAKKVRELEKENLGGFIFKSRSPSCGMERVKICLAGRRAEKKGVGIFARAFMEHFPLVPAEEDGRLHDLDLRENFIGRIFVCLRWRELGRTGKTPGGLVDFHSRHKMLILSHSEEHYRRMGPLVAQGKERAPETTYAEYETLLMEALKRRATARKHTNVLQHLLGYFKKQLSVRDRQEMLEIIEQFRLELIPLIVPVTMLRHYAGKYGIDYLADQYYLNPHPLEQQLKNHA